jgi:hypothetical protein
LRACGARGTKRRDDRAPEAEETLMPRLPPITLHWLAGRSLAGRRVARSSVAGRSVVGRSVAGRRVAGALATLALACAGDAAALPTHVIVRAIARDAKFIGDSMGGVRVTLTDARTGRRLAQGVTAGGTGDTQKLVVAPRVRGQAVSTPDAARFDATVDIDAPTLVRAEAVGPLGKPGAEVTVSSMTWLLPGQTAEGDGWILEFPGLVVEPAWSVAGDGGLRIVAKVTLMCGCLIEPGGHWDAAAYEVRAQLLDQGLVVADAPLAPGGGASSFSGALRPPASGRFHLRVTARNQATGNTGVAELPIDAKGP